MSRKVLPGGGDWPAISNDGENSWLVNVPAVLQTDDGARIFVQYYAFIEVPLAKQGNDKALAALDSAEYYFCTHPPFAPMIPVTYS